MGSTQSSTIGLCCLSRLEDTQELKDQSQLLTNRAKSSHSNHDMANELLLDQLSPPVTNEEMTKTATSPVKTVFNSGIDNQQQSYAGRKYSDNSSISSKSSTDAGIDEILLGDGQIEQRNDDEELLSRCLGYERGREQEEELRVAQSSLDEAATEALSSYYDTSRPERGDDIDEASLRCGDDAERDDCMMATM